MEAKASKTNVLKTSLDSVSGEPRIAVDNAKETTAAAGTTGINFIRIGKNRPTPVTAASKANKYELSVISHTLVPQAIS
jgi:hypothetical protein